MTANVVLVNIERWRRNKTPQLVTIRTVLISIFLLPDRGSEIWLITDIIADNLTDIIVDNFEQHLCKCLR